jgi:hypothetical protein
VDVATWRLERAAASTPHPGSSILYRTLLPSTKAENTKYIHGGSINTVNTDQAKTVNTTPLPNKI